MINGETMWQSDEGQTELAYAKQSKFLASKLNHPKLHYISNLSTINHPAKAGTQMHSLHQSRLYLPLFFSSSSPGSLSQPLKLFAPVYQLHSISIAHPVTSLLYHPHSLSIVGLACRIRLHKSKLISPSHSFSFIFILDPATSSPSSSISALPISVPSLALPAQ